MDFKSKMMGKRLFRTFASLVLAFSGPTVADEAKPGEWQSLYQGTLDDFRIYFRGQGYIEDVAKQEVFAATEEGIHVHQGTNGLIVTKTPYDYYHVKVDYRWGKEGGKKNAGLLTHVDLKSTVQKDNRPKSVEINMKHGSVWKSFSEVSNACPRMRP